MSEDLAHDAHLRAALRHAPDHALSPPSGLSQTILTAARQAHAPVRASVAPPPVRMRAAGRRPLSRWLAGVFAPRWAGAWAVGLIAALGLGLWLDLESQPVLDRTDSVATGTAPPPATVHAQAARAPTAGDTAVADAPVAETLAKASPPAPAPANRQTTATATPGAAAPTAAMRVDERSAARRKEMTDAAQGRVAATTTPTETPVRQQAAATEPAAQGNVTATADNRLAAPAAAAPAPTAATGAEAQPPAPTVARANEQPSAPAVAAIAPEATDLRATLAARGARKAELGETVAAASPALTLLRRAQAEIAAGTATWTWAPPGSAAMAPWDDAAQAWLSRLVYAARGRWVDVSERGESLDALEVRWWRDGWPHATLRIEADGLRWIEPSGRIRYAPLEAGTLQRLRSF